MNHLAQHHNHVRIMQKIELFVNDTVYIQKHKRMLISIFLVCNLKEKTFRTKYILL